MEQLSTSSREKLQLLLGRQVLEPPLHRALLLVLEQLQAQELEQAQALQA